MPRTNETCAKVYLWWNRGNLAKRWLGSGHAAVAVKKGLEKTYITWYPNGRGGSARCLQSVSGHSAFSQCQSVEANRDLGFSQLQNTEGQIIPNPLLGNPEEIASYHKEKAVTYGCRADIKLTIPAMNIGSDRIEENLFGVNLDWMLTFWNRLLQLPPGHAERRFAMLSTEQNCCGTVVKALIAGGLDLYAPPPCNYIYQGCRTLYNWVIDGTAVIDRLNTSRATLNQECKFDQALTYMTPRDAAMPTLKQWEKQSDVGTGLFARRREQVAQIDKLIPQYHNAKAQQQDADRFRILAKMHCLAISHLTQKPNSVRRPALIDLAKRVLYQLTHPDDFFQGLRTRSIDIAPEDPQMVLINALRRQSVDIF